MGNLNKEVKDRLKQLSIHCQSVKTIDNTIYVQFKHQPHWTMARVLSDISVDLEEENPTLVPLFILAQTPLEGERK